MHTVYNRIIVCIGLRPDGLKMKRILLSMSVTILLPSLVLANSKRIINTLPFVDYAPEPRLIAPIKEEIDLTKKTELEFKWSPHEGVSSDRRYYDFRLYKGSDLLKII